MKEDKIKEGFIPLVSALEIFGKWIATRNRNNSELGRNFKEALSQRGYWSEFGGLFILSARQTGKTTALRGFINMLKEYFPDDRVVSVCQYRSQMKILDAGDSRLVPSDYEFENRLRGRSDQHLVVDNFNSLDRETMNLLLSIRWKSVTMIGTMQ